MEGRKKLNAKSVHDNNDHFKMKKKTQKSMKLLPERHIENIDENKPKKIAKKHIFQIMTL